MLDRYDIGWIYVAKRGKPTRQNSDQIKVGVSTRPSNRDGKTFGLGDWSTLRPKLRTSGAAPLTSFACANDGEW